MLKPTTITLGARATPKIWHPKARDFSGSATKAKKAKIDLQTREGQPQSDGPGPQISWEAHGTVRAMQGPGGPSQSHLSQS